MLICSERRPAERGSALCVKMNQSRPKLSNLKRVCPQDLAHCEGFVWHLGTKIGKGSFGEVYLGWTNDGCTEVAVKVVRKEFFKQDPKVRENLEREIRILKLLRGCEYVVQILHVQELKQCIVLVMELCDYDLDHLVKVEPFREETIIVFLYQLAQGMKALRNQNIVHRDLKPGNILIKRHPTTNKMMIKLADFGFARHFKDEGNKAIDMTSLAGTPVFMAPEALSCVFHPGEHYDDKVDIWSIGALLYKIIVGQCGFYAQLQDIPRILKHKGDAIAFERAPNRKINYIYELPSSVNDRLSESFRDKMRNLLCSMLKLDPRERMTFTEFFETVDDIIRSKIEVVNILHGTTVKIISDPALTADVLTDKVHIQWHVPSMAQVIFSTACPQFISPYETISQTQLIELLEKSGGSEGHAKLFMLPFKQLSLETVPPDLTCFTPLKYTVDDEVTIVNLITEQKFSDEIVHMIGYMGSQQKKQLEGLEELAIFTSREMRLFSTNVHPFLLEQVHQSFAKATLALRWLNEDAAIFDGSQEISSLCSSIEAISIQLKQDLQELFGFNRDPIPTHTFSLTREEITKTVSALSERAKKLPKVRRDQIQAVCNQICNDCVEEISRVTKMVKAYLQPFGVVLDSMWSLKRKATDILERCSALNRLIDQVSMERSKVLRSAHAGTVVQETRPQAASNHLPPIVPPVWTSPVGGSYAGGQSWTDPSTVDNLKRQVDLLKSQLASTCDENNRLKADLTSLKVELDKSVSSPSAVEATLIPSEVSQTPQQTSDNVKTVERLCNQLRNFCVLAEKLNMGAGPGTRPASSGNAASGGALYPSLLDDYSVISMPSSADCYDVDKLLPMAQQLSTSLSVNVSALENMASRSSKEISTLTSNQALVKIARPNEYNKGDIVLFTPIRTVKSKSTIPLLLHLQQSKPHILLDPASYSNFNVRPGKMPELLIAKLTDVPRIMKSDENLETAHDLGDNNDFYYVNAESVPLKFSTQRAGSASTLDPPTRPSSSPRLGSPGGASQGFKWKPKPLFHKPHGHRSSDKNYV